MEVQTKIPRVRQDRKLWDLKGDDCKINKVALGPLPTIPENGGNLPWKKGDLLDSLDLSSTNLEKFMKRKDEDCGLHDQEKEERDWLVDNFRESIKEWAPKRPEANTQIPDPPSNNLQDLIPHKNPNSQLKPSTPPQSNPNPHTPSSPERQTHLTKRIIPRGKSALNQKLQELKENHKPTKKLNYFNEKLPEKASTRYSGSDLEDENPQDHQIHISEFKINPTPQTAPNPTSVPKNLQLSPEKNLPPKLTQKPPSRPSKFVSKFKNIESEKDDFLDIELKCLNDEEAKLEASLVRLDIKKLKLKHQADLEILDQQAKILEESLARRKEEMLKGVAAGRESCAGNGGKDDNGRLVKVGLGKMDLKGKEGRGRDVEAECVGNHSDLLEDKGNGRGRDGCKTRNYSNQVVKNYKQGIADDRESVAPTNYSGKPCDSAQGPRARSVASRYSSRSSNPKIKLRGQFQKPPLAPQSNNVDAVPLGSAGIVKVNPNIDLKSIFSDLSSP